MLTGIAVIPTGPRYMPYGWVFVVVVVLVILLIFVRVYGLGNRSGRRTANHAERVPGRGGNNGRRAASRRRPSRR